MLDFKMKLFIYERYVGIYENAKKDSYIWIIIAFLCLSLYVHISICLSLLWNVFSQETKIRVFRVLFSSLLCVPLWKQISICLFRLYFINQTIYIWVGDGLCVCPTIQKMFFHTKQKSDFSYFRFCIVVCSPLKTDIDLSISALFY